jgi:hypothetical protein
MIADATSTLLAAAAGPTIISDSGETLLMLLLAMAEQIIYGKRFYCTSVWLCDILEAIANRPREDTVVHTAVVPVRYRFTVGRD